MGDGPGLLFAAEKSERGFSAFKLSKGRDKTSSMLLLAGALGDACELSPGLGVLFVLLLLLFLAGTSEPLDPLLDLNIFQGKLLESCGVDVAEAEAEPLAVSCPATWPGFGK